MSASSLWDRAMRGEPEPFGTVIEVRESEVVNMQSMLDGLPPGTEGRSAIGEQINGGGLVVVRAPWSHHAHLLLCSAEPGDLMAVRGVAELIDAGLGGKVMLVEKPARVELWRRVRRSPEIDSVNGLLADFVEGA